MPSSQIEIVNGALVELGETILSGLPQNTLASDVALQVYDQVYQDLLGKAPWRFAVKKETLSQDIATPPNEWTYQYSLPAQCMRVLRVYPQARYEIFKNKLYANTSELAIDYVEKVSESYLPAPFVRLFTLELAVRMCMSITNDVDLKKSLQQDARMQFAAALSADAQQRPNVPIVSSPFVDVRQSG
jgi:hypothetical protein